MPRLIFTFDREEVLRQMYDEQRWDCCPDTREFEEWKQDVEDYEIDNFVKTHLDYEYED